jgi:hypothetical protein
MAFSLQEKMGELISLYLTARDAPTKEAASALANFLKDLIVILPNALKTIQDAAKSGDLDKPGQKHDQSIKRIEDAITIESVSDLSKFFSGVSQAVVDAQEDLNQQSLDYIKHLPQHEGRALIPPSYFAIPSVKAEMKVGISQVKGKGINVVIFHKKEQQQNYSESTISFEVVSAPVPPSTQLPPPASPPEGTTPPNTSPTPLAGPKPIALNIQKALAESSLADAEFGSPPELFGFGSPPVAGDSAKASDFADAFDFAALFADLEERERALDIREQWLEVRAQLLGNRAMLLGDKTVLDFIRRELQARGQELGKLYDNTEDLALILSYTKQADRTGYLVLWPGRAETDRPETWRELRVFHLMRVGGALAFDTSVFETTPGEGFLLLTSRKDLLTLSPEEVADVSINLGDVLMKIVLVFNEWLNAE